MQKNVLGLFAKRPDAGLVKTRLAAETSPAFAASVAEAFLDDVARRLATLAYSRIICCDPEEANAYFVKRYGSDFEVIDQGLGDLGQRLARFFQRQLSDPSTRAVVVGADSPSLPFNYIEEAFSRLDVADVVMGPSVDGGYYLLGCRQFIPSLFEEMPWSTASVAGKTLRRVVDGPWKLAMLPMWYDVDTLADWQFLELHLAALKKSGTELDLPNIERILGTSPVS